MKINKVYSSLFLFSVLTLSVSAIAATDSTGDGKTTDSPPNVSKTNVEGIVEKSKTLQTDNVDELLTNNNLRALTGSKSKWSISSQLSYQGSTINTPLAEDRPNIAGSSATTPKSDLEGQVSVKYNLNATNSLMAGIGVRWIAPTAGTKGPGPVKTATGSKDYPGTTYDASNPYLMYQKVFTFAGVQSVTQLQGLQWTQSDYTSIGYDKQLSITQLEMYEIPRTRLSVGAALGYQYTTFNKNSEGGVSVEDEQSDVVIQLAPIVEYQLNDKWNLRTALNPWIFEHARSQADSTTYFEDRFTQSVGVGYAVNRDIFLYPNVQFLPEHISSELTNVGIQATINVF